MIGLPSIVAMTVSGAASRPVQPAQVPRILGAAGGRCREANSAAIAQHADGLAAEQGNIIERSPEGRDSQRVRR